MFAACGFFGNLLLVGFNAGLNHGALAPVGVRASDVAHHDSV